MSNLLWLKFIYKTSIKENSIKKILFNYLFSNCKLSTLTYAMKSLFYAYNKNNSETIFKLDYKRIKYLWKK